jgi:TRAP-type uncharacterized transport system substrate-binding protein
MQGLTHGPNPARGQAASMRVNALIQIAHEMSLDRSNPERPFNTMQVVLGSTKDGAFQPRLSFANGDYDLANTVARGDLDLATVNPSAYVTMAYRGTGPFSKPLDLRTIAVMPTLDYMLFAVSKESGLTSIPDIRDKKYPLKLSIRGSQAHGTRFIIDEVFKANGFSLKDVESWGGKFFYCESPNNAERFELMRTGGVDAVFDEGVKGWGYVAIECGMNFLDLDPASRKQLETVGWGLCPGKAIFDFFPDDFMAASFSGWPIFTRADVPDDVAYQMAKALDSAWDRVIFDLREGEVATLADVCTGTDAAPNDIPLHPGAVRYYRERGIQV